MATREITKRPPQYSEAELESELIPIREESGDRVSIDKLRVLWDRRALLYRWAMIGLVASTIIAFLIPPRYTTTVHLMPPSQGGQGLASIVGALGKAGELASLGSDLFGVKTSGDLFVGVLKSEKVENAIINKFDLRKLYGVRRYEDARKKLESRTDVSSDRKSGIITIKVTDTNPGRAAQMGQEYVDQLNQVMISLDTSAAHRERVFLENRLKEVEQDLESAEKDFSQFASKNAALDVKEQGRAMIGAAGELEGELIAAQTELQGLRQIYTNNNVRVRSLEARISEYRRQLQKMGGKSGSTNDDTSVVPGAGQTGSEQSQDLVPTIRQLPILGVTWSDLYRRTKVEETIFETLTKQYEVARVDEVREIPSIKVLDQAAVPEKKSFPPRLLLMLFGTVLAATLAGFWAVLSARWEQVDSDHPRKLLVQEIVQTMQSKPWISRAMHVVRRNGSTRTSTVHEPKSSANGQSSDEPAD
jgi:capsule polysaccharide export protein KpsE/RkpR